MPDPVGTLIAFFLPIIATVETGGLRLSQLWLRRAEQACIRPPKLHRLHWGGAPNPLRKRRKELPHER